MDTINAIQFIESAKLIQEDFLLEKRMLQIKCGDIIKKYIQENIIDDTSIEFTVSFAKDNTTIRILDNTINIYHYEKWHAGDEIDFNLSWGSSSTSFDNDKYNYIPYLIVLGKIANHIKNSDGLKKIILEQISIMEVISAKIYDLNTQIYAARDLIIKEEKQAEENSIHELIDNNDGKFAVSVVNNDTFKYYYSKDINDRSWQKYKLSARITISPFDKLIINKEKKNEFIVTFVGFEWRNDGNNEYYKHYHDKFNTTRKITRKQLFDMLLYFKNSLTKIKI